MQRERTGGQQAALFVASEELGPRRWMVPALLALFVLAPLLRWGVPITEAGALALHPRLARHLALPDLFTALLGTNEFSYKLMLGLSSLLATAAVAWAAGRWWRGQSWWLVALWLVSPLHLMLLYHSGWPHHLHGVAFLAFGLGVLTWRGRLQWLALPPLLAGSLLLWTTGSALSPSALFAPLTVGGDPALWLAQEGAPLPVVPLFLAVVVGLLAWERGRRPPKLSVALLIAALGAGLALWSGDGALLGLALSTLGLVLATGTLPRLDPRFGTWPVTVGIAAIAALAVYPALQPPWQNEPPRPRGESAFFGTTQIALLGAQLNGDGTGLEAAWQVTAPVQQDLTVFVHWLDGRGEQVAQSDTPLLDEAGRPTTQWPIGTVVRQTYPLDSTVDPASVRLGLYDPITGARMPRPDGGDSVTVPLP